MTTRAFRLIGGLLLVCSLNAATIRDARADLILSDNLGATTGGTELATVDRWLAASFATDGSDYQLSAVTLLLQRTSIGGAVRLDLYSDGGLEPGALVGTLTSPGTVTSSLGQVTFGGAGLSLSANSTYWVVLSAATGSFEWAWSSQNTGSGAGFRKTWSRSDDAGLTWFSTDNFPFQMSVTAAAVPEPPPFVLMGVGGAVLLAARHRRRARPC